MAATPASAERPAPAGYLDSSPPAHTPGPWVVNADTDIGREFRRTEMPAGYASIDSLTADGPCKASYGLALVTVIELDDTFESPSDVGFANAHLIAAAPELLAELKRLLRRYERCAALHGNDAETIAISTEDVRAAIAKAEGRGSPDTTPQSNDR